MANQKIVDYLQKVEKIRNKGFYRIPNGKVKDLVREIDRDYQPCKKISHEGLEIFVKHYGSLHTYNPTRQNNKFTSDIVLSRLYNALGVNSATYYPMTTTRGFLDKEDIDLIVSQSIVDMPGYRTKQAVADEKMNHIISVMCADDTYSIAGIINSRPDMIEYDGRFANDEFFGDFVSMHILDNIFMQEDRTVNNFFTYEDKKSGKCGIITYDHERLGLDKFADINDKDFRDMISGKAFACYAPISMCPVCSTKETYPAKIKNIAKILDSGVLGKSGEDLKNRLSSLKFIDVVEESERQGYPMSRDRVNKIGILLENAQNEICKTRTK